jgi:hypothetical protein
MASAKVPTLSPTGYPKNHKPFDAAMEKLWNEVVSKERREELKKVENFLNDDSGHGKLNSSEI